MRALAVLGVVVVHSALFGQALSSSLSGRLLAHLNIGVTIFFLISGFLLYRPFIAHRVGGASAPANADYAKRRFLRIYPAYWVALTVLVVVPGVTGVVDGNWWPMYGLVHTLPIYGGQTCVGSLTVCGLAQTWSLVVEVTFYLALPLYALVVGRLTRRLSVRSWLIAELLLLAVLSTLSVVLEYGTDTAPPKWLGVTVAGYVFWFALGMGMAVISVGLGEARKPWLARSVGPYLQLLWPLAAGAYVLLCLWLAPNPFLFARNQALVAHVAFGIIAALLLAPAVFGDRSNGLPGRLLSRPTIAWLGLVSYGIFLWHYVVALKLGSSGADASFGVVLLGTLAISILCAAASYYVIERPFLRLKYRRQGEMAKDRRQPLGEVDLIGRPLSRPDESP